MYKSHALRDLSSLALRGWNMVGLCDKGTRKGKSLSQNAAFTAPPHHHHHHLPIIECSTFEFFERARRGRRGLSGPLCERQVAARCAHAGGSSSLWSRRTRKTAIYESDAFLLCQTIARRLWCAEPPAAAATASQRGKITSQTTLPSRCVLLVLLKMISWVGFLLRRCALVDGALMQLFVPFKEARLDYCERADDLWYFILLLPLLHKSRSIRAFL